MHSATYPVRPSPGSRSLQLMTNTAQLPSIVEAKRVRSASLRSDRSGSRGVSSSLSSRQSNVPVESVMTMNKEAMTILQEGDIASSHKKLTEALLVAEAGARRCGSSSGSRRVGAKEREEQREAWLIAFAATLSNLGCVRRRANELQDALLYLEDARKVEQNVFGKPSCSTMVNLSAVLLGLGKANEALAIARDCATASESGDPMLHVIALHNYGVTLSDHATAEVRQRAVPVLMRALREAESHFGIAHPTTILIRERCGMLTAHPSSPKDRATVSVHVPSHKNSSLSSRSIHNAPLSTQMRHPSRTRLLLQEERQLQTQQQKQQQQQPYKKQLPQKQQQQQQQLEEQRLIALRPLPPLVSNAQQRAKEALQALDYGAPLVPLRAASCKASVDTTALIAAGSPRPPLAPIASEKTHSEGNGKETPQAAVPRTDSLSRGSSNCPVPLQAKSFASVSLPSRSSRDAPVLPIGVKFESIEWDTAGGNGGVSQSECIEHTQEPPPQTTHNIPGDKAIDLSFEDKPTNGSTVQPTNESTVQPTNESTVQPTNGSTVHPTNESTVQPTNGSTVQPTNGSTVQPMNGSTVQPMNGSTVQPTNESTVQPTNGSTVQPTNESTVQPTNESAVQPTNGSTVQPTNGSTVQPMNGSTVQPMNGSTVQPTNESTVQPTNGSTVQPTNESTVQPTNESTVQPTNGSTVQPTNGSTVEPTNESIVQPTNESVVQPTNESVVQPTNESVVQPTNESVVQPTNKSVVQPTNESVVQPTNESVVQPTNKSVVQPTNESAVQPTNRRAKPSKSRTLWTGEFIDLRDRRLSEEPSFFRFSHKLPPSSTAHTVPAPLADPKPSGGPSLATTTGDSLSASVVDTAAAAEAEAFGPEAVAQRTHKAFVRIFGESPAARREQRLQAESIEEFALRAERRARAEEAARQKYVEETFARITARTRNRAARAIQYTWLYWWNAVGRRRRELRQQREAERQRRERTRLALIEHERLLNEAQQRKSVPAQKPQSYSTPESAVRCARKWLACTAAVRAAARGLLAGPARREAQWSRCIAVVQSVWRGRVARGAVALKRAAMQRERKARAAQEAHMCAALVLTRAWRSAAARALLREKYNAHFGPVATRLQQWARAAMERRKALGIDRVSRLRRENAARRIQRQWRRHAALLAYYMLQLREKLNACRSVEAKAALLLQRCGRGALDRNRIAAHDAQVRRIQQAQAYVRGELVLHDNNNEGPFECRAEGMAKGPISHYVPTPAAEVAAIRERERELYHVNLFVEPVAQRTRAEWADALRLRPLDVRLRRANEDLLCTLELCTARRERAARRIQREFRSWRRIRDAEFRDNTLLLINRGRYQEDELGKKVDQIRFRREFAGGQKLFGDQTAPMREELAIARAELEEMEPLVRSHVPWEEIRCPHERYDTEMALRRDEELIERNKSEEEIACVREETMRRAIKGLARSSSNKLCL